MELTELTDIQREALNLITEGWCPICKTQFKNKRPRCGDRLYCDKGYTAEQAKREFGLPDVMRLPRRR